MKKYFIFIAVIFISFFVSSFAFACEPCPKILNLEETINKSDLIIVGQKVSDGPKSDFGPAWIEVKIIETLKGSIQDAKIKVSSWYGMCSYGIIIDDNKNYLILLQKAENAEENISYTPVDWGCSQKKYLVENNQIDLNGEKISLENLASKYGLKIPKKTIDNNRVQIQDSNNTNAQTKDSNGDTTQIQNFKVYYIIGAFVILALLIFGLLKILRKK